MKNDSLYINISLPWGVVEKTEKGPAFMLAEKHRERCKSIIVAAKSITTSRNWVIC